MSYKAKDGRVFGHPQQGMKYDESLTAERSKGDLAEAPGGEEYEHNLKSHGMILESHIKIEGPGRFRLSVTHKDGHVSESVHPQWYTAQERQGQYFNPDGPPKALDTVKRSRSHPTGQKEDERIAQEDGRESGMDDVG